MTFGTRYRPFSVCGATAWKASRRFGFGDRIGAQALEDILGVGHGFDAGGIDGLHLFDQAEDAVQSRVCSAASSSLTRMRARWRCV
jgi:hypothetical protein